MRTVVPDSTIWVWLQQACMIAASAAQLAGLNKTRQHILPGRDDAYVCDDNVRPQDATSILGTHVVCSWECTQLATHCTSDTRQVHTGVPRLGRK